MPENTYTAEQLTEIINDFIRDNQENLEVEQDPGYNTGYIHGYHDALVDLMNKLRLPHDWEIYND